MAFEGLTEKLSSAFKKLRGKGRLKESDVKEAMREIRMALLEADVSYKVVKDFTKSVTERCIGADVLEALSPAQMIVKIVNEELVKLMGAETKHITINPNGPTVVMLVGLQGAGKTTNGSKLAGLMKRQGKNPLLVACDIYRPAAIQQLKVCGEKLGVPVFEKGQTDPVQIAKEAVLYAGSLGIYDGYVNGQRIGNLNKETGKREYDELKPGWTDYEDRLFYNTYDITEYLVKNDENAMAFMLGTGWWCGRVSQGTYGYHLPAFIGELHILYEDGTKEVIGTDESWVYRKDTAVVSADIYNGEVYDAGKVTTAQESVFLERDSDVHKPVYLPAGEVLGFSGEFQAFYGYSVKELEEYSRKPESVMAYEGAVSDNSTFGYVQEVPVVWTEGTENGSVTEADIRENGTVSGAGIEEKDVRNPLRTLSPRRWIGGILSLVCSTVLIIIWVMSLVI